ncbi:MAG: NADH-quinone oxidoreductase subunit C [Opitutales bacterium]|nr:NADH-quinone oxidoreductase subunit C [Opitutales bacterium]
MDTEKLVSELPFLKARKTADGAAAFDCPGAELVRAAETLRDKFQFQSLNDIAALDFGADLSENRFGAVYHFYSHANREYCSLRAVCPSAEKPVLPSLCGVFKGADWHERECFDMMGIVFESHPRLARILMWDSYPYYPLRKDFPLAGREAPLPPSFEGNEGATKIVPAPEEGGPFHSPSDGAAFSPQKEPRSAEK